MIMLASGHRTELVAVTLSVVVHALAAGAILLRSDYDRVQATRTAPEHRLEIRLEQRAAQRVSASQVSRQPAEMVPQEPVKVLQRPAAISRQAEPESPHPRTDAPQERRSQRPVERQQRVASSPSHATQISTTKQAEAEPSEIDYLSRLQAHIESYKYYPRSARKQGIQGAVGVRFELHEGGRISPAKCSGGHRLLRHAAERAIQDSLPLPAPPEKMRLPLDIHFEMHYTLRH